MQLLLCSGKQWEAIEVSLLRGSIPCIGGTPLDQSQLETALWFKVAADVQPSTSGNVLSVLGA